MAKSMTVTVSFKKDEKWMYDLISQKSDKACYIKDLLKLALNSEPVAEIPKVKETNMDGFLEF